MITLLTKPTGIHPFNSEWVKYYASKMTGKRRGPEMVARSLSRGLDELSVAHRFNPFFLRKLDAGDVVHIINGAQTLEWALRLKSSGKIGTLIAGPAISVVPEDHNSILRNPLIDTIVFPGQWTKDFFSSVDPYYKNKIEVWPAGVQSNVDASNRNNGRGIVYFKSVTPEIRATVIASLAEKHIAYDSFEYGQFNQADYFAALETSDWMIYLSPSESQGIALQEAWIRDVPTLVWDCGVWNYQASPSGKKYSWKTPLVSAPYLSPESGMTFANAASFKTSFEHFIQKLPTFAPRAYCMHKLTDVESAARFLQILEITAQK